MSHGPQASGMPLCNTVMGSAFWLQDKRKAEAERQKELAELFAVAIKQPKVPAGKQVSATCDQITVSLSNLFCHSKLMAACFFLCRC